MDIVNIYGPIPDKSELVIGIGNANNINGLLTYSSLDLKDPPTTTSKSSFMVDRLQMKSLSQITSSKIPEVTLSINESSTIYINDSLTVVEVILNYEKPLTDSDKLYFSLCVKDPKNTAKRQFININIVVDGNKKIACATISHEKSIFTIDYSSIDRTPRFQLMSGAFYSLQTVFGEQNYIVSWNQPSTSINNTSHSELQNVHDQVIEEQYTNYYGDLIVFLPTTWYEYNTNTCQLNSGVINLIENLNQTYFKGYTTTKWCEEVPSITHCTNDKLCGECLGSCRDTNDICYINSDPNNTDKFACVVSTKDFTLVSFANGSNPPQTTGTLATWIALIAIFILVALLVWGLTKRKQTIS